MCECVHGWEEEVSMAHNNLGERGRGGASDSQGAFWSVSPVGFLPPLLHWCYADNVRLDLPLAAQLSNQVTSS